MPGTVSVYEITVYSDDEPDYEVAPTIERIIEEGDVVDIVMISSREAPAVRPSTAMPFRATVPDNIDDWTERVNGDGSLKDTDQ